MSVKKYNIPPDTVDFLLHCKCRHNVFLLTYVDDNLKGVGCKGGGGVGNVPSDATHFLSSDLIHATRLLLNGKKLTSFYLSFPLPRFSID